MGQNIYTQKIFDWTKYKKIGITFIQVGKLCLHKLCQNKHFSTTGTIKVQIQKEKTFS